MTMRPLTQICGDVFNFARETIEELYEVKEPSKLQTAAFTFESEADLTGFNTKNFIGQDSFLHFEAVRKSENAYAIEEIEVRRKTFAAERSPLNSPMPMIHGIYMADASSSTHCETHKITHISQDGASKYFTLDAAIAYLQKQEQTCLAEPKMKQARPAYRTPMHYSSWQIQTPKNPALKIV